MFSKPTRDYLDALMPALRALWPAASWHAEKTDSGIDYLVITLPCPRPLGPTGYVILEPTTDGYSLYCSLSDRTWQGADPLDLLDLISQKFNLMSGMMPIHQTRQVIQTVN